MKIRTVIIFTILRLLFICTISAVLGIMGIHLDNWRFWVILGSSIGLYVCGVMLGICNKQFYKEKK